MNKQLTRSSIIEIKNKHKIKLLFSQYYEAEIFHALHNPFSHTTEYHLMITPILSKPSPYIVGDYYDESNDVYITIAWGAKGYKYITLKRLGNMLKKEYPELLI